MKYIIKKYNAIKQSGLAKFPKGKYTVSKEAEDPDAIICRSAQLHNEKLSKNLKIIARAGVGVNNIPIEECSKRGIVVCNTPGANSTAVKELVIASMIIASRNIHHSVNWVQYLKQDTTPYKETGLSTLVEKEKKNFAGSEIYGKTIGIIGLGAIGQKLAQSCISLGLNILGFDPYLREDNILNSNSHFTHIKSLDELCQKSDYISIHVPYLESTHHLINTKLLTQCKKNCVLLNFSRAELVNSKAIIQALNKKQLASYVTDFPTEDLLHHPSVLSIPHLGASTEESEENCAIMAADQICQFLEYGTITHSVNFPRCSLELSSSSKTRLLIGNNNIKNVVGHITSTLGSFNINIENMINKNKKNLAYNIIDISEDIDTKVIKKISSIPDIIFVRHISLQ